jgi:hypothetical protein
MRVMQAARQTGLEIRKPECALELFQQLYTGAELTPESHLVKSARALAEQMAWLT